MPIKTITCPDLGEGLDHASVLQIHRSINQHIDQGQSIITLETAKSVVDIPSPYTGRVCNLHVQKGQNIHIGMPMFSIDDGICESIQPIKAMPGARSLAREYHIDLSVIKPRHGDIITIEDISNIINQQKLDKPSLNTTNTPGENRSKSPVACSIFDEATLMYPCKDITVVTLMALLKALKECPKLNAHFIDNELKILKDIHCAIAVQTQDKLELACIRHLDQHHPASLRQAINKIKQQQKNGQLKSNQHIQPPTVMFSNIGIQAGRYASALINPPSILTVVIGRCFQDVSWDPTRNQPQPCFKLPLSLHFDHRAISGLDVARGLGCMMTYIEQYTHLTSVCESVKT